MQTKTIHLYRLTDARGFQTFTVVDDPADNGCIGGYDKDGKYHQYDSYELRHAYTWAEERGMKLEYAEMQIQIPDALFK
jgi:hypothetical protein